MAWVDLGVVQGHTQAPNLRKKMASKNTVADPDLQIRRAPSHPDSEIREGGGVSKNIFQPFGPHFGVKIRGGGPPGLSPGSATEINIVGKCLIGHSPPLSEFSAPASDGLS